MYYTQEYIEELLSKCKALIDEPDTEIYFSDPIIIKPTPHTELFRCYGCVLTDSGALKLMDVEQEWHEVETNQANVGHVLQGLYQRLKAIQAGIIKN
jgi:hypothetical protein